MRSMSLIRIGKRGSYTVFLAMFLSGMILMASAAINAAHEKAVFSSCEDLGRVWAGSILGEYDRTLRDRYGLYGYYGNEDLVRKKLEAYADHSFKGKKYIKREEMICHTEEYRLMEPKTMKEQISHLMISFWKPVPFEDEAAVNTDDDANETGSTRSISAGWIIEALPSHCYKGDPLGGLGIGGSVPEISYIFKAFKDHVDKRDLGKTYFENEIEYIISGKLNDEKSRRTVYDKLLIERNGMNLIYLYSCTEKRQMALEAAELLTPGPEAVITQALILEAWAFFEARNDIELLYDGKQVPVFKRDENWALDIDTVIESEFKDNENGELDTRESKKYVEPESIEGQTYGDYLKTLLLAVPESKRLLRIMDLIQINMKYAYCDYFLMADYYTGLEFEMTVNGRRHDFSERFS